MLKVLALCLAMILLACLFGACGDTEDEDADNTDQKYEENVGDEEDVSREEADTEEPIEVDENGVLTRKGYEQLLEQEHQKALEEEDKQLLEDAQKAYEDYLNELPMDDPSTPPSGAKP